MNNLLKAIALTACTGLTGCMGWADFGKIPPSSIQMWTKSGISENFISNDLASCRLVARQSGIEGGRQSVHFVEACMLEKGYTFTNYGSRDAANYCSNDWWGGGPACKSVGR